MKQGTLQACASVVRFPENGWGHGYVRRPKQQYRTRTSVLRCTYL